MSDSKMNQAVAANLAQFFNETITSITKLSEQDLSNASNQLVLVDVDMDDKFLRYLDPTTFAESLIKCGLSPSVSSVVFLISDFNQQRNLFEFSRSFIGQLQKAFEHEVTAYVPTDLNYSATLLVPPKTIDANWQVYGIQSRPNPTQFNLSILQSMKDKTLLWEGPKILDWICTKQRELNTPFGRA